MANALTQVARRVWDALHETSVACLEYSTPIDVQEFDELTFSEQFVPRSMRVHVERTRSFRIHTSGLGTHVDIHTCDDKRPSSSILTMAAFATLTLETLYGPCPCEQGVCIFLLPGGPRTRLPVGQSLQIDQVNSAFSTTYRGWGIAVCYRCAEMHRLIVHELMHVWRVHDTSDVRDVECDAELRALGCPFGASVRLSEAVVEALTWLVLLGTGHSTEEAEMHHAAVLAHSYLACDCDAGHTNAWAYIVGRYLLIADGGDAFCAWVLADASSRARRVRGAAAWRDIIKIMLDNRIHLQPSAFPDGPLTPIRNFSFDFGTSFS